MNPAAKRFQKRFGGVADAIATVDIDQLDREAVAEAVATAFEGQPDFRRDLFVLLASDPLVPCAGYDLDGEPVPCPHGRVIRIAMHNSSDPQGRSAVWQERAPYGSIRCVTCGAAQFLPGYRDAIRGRA